MGDQPTRATATTEQNPNVTRVLSADDHEHGWNADGTPIDVLMLLLYGGAWVYFTFLQMTSTEDSVFGLLQSSVSVPPSATPQQMQDAFNGAMDHNHVIAFAIAFSVQLFLMMLAFPITRALLLAHHKMSKTLPASASTGREAAAMAKWQKVIMKFLIGADILTDFFYAVSGHSVFAGTIFWFVPGFNPAGGLGVFLVGIVYPIAVCGATIYFGNIGFKRLGSLLHRLQANVKK